MERNMFARFADGLKRLGADGIGAPEFSLGRDGKYDLQYIPFEHVNLNARLVIVGITPGNNQLELAYGKAQQLLRAGCSEAEIIIETKKAGAFGGPSMKPNLLKILRHFRFERFLGIHDVDTLWGGNADLLHSTSVVPHAAFKAGKPFNGSFEEIMDSPLLEQCFLDCFMPSVQEMGRDAVFVALGPCPQEALEWCVNKGALRQEQVLGSFCHPSSAGGSMTSYYLRNISKDDLNPRNPVRSRCDWLDQAYEQMRSATSSLLSKRPKATVAARAIISTKSAAMPEVIVKPATDNPKAPAPLVDATNDIAAIMGEFGSAGYKATRETSKVVEFQSSTGQLIYLIKEISRLNRIKLVVHPSLKPTGLAALAGVDSVADGYYHNAHMARFPKRFNKGAKDIHYGRQLSLETLAALSRFLSAFKLDTF